MASTVVGLFERHTDAEAALTDLVGSGFGRGEIDLRAPGDAGADSDDLIRELEGEGVPPDDARLYLAGVRSGDSLEIARTDDDRATQAQEIMNRHGALDIHDAHAVRGVAPAAAVGAAGLGAAGLGAAAPAADTRHADTRHADVAGETVIPIVEEELAVGKRQIQRGGVRVFQRTEERPVAEQVTLREEHVTVQRQAVDRPVTDADAAFRGGTVEVTTTAEVPVVSKEARVVEEVVVGKAATERTETVRDTVRRTEVEVEQVDGPTTRTTDRI